MKVMNIMLSRGRGGIEQAFVNSVQAIDQYSDFHQLPIVDEKSTVTGRLNSDIRTIRQFADWDPIGIYALYRHIHQINPDLILCHGNRPLKMVLRLKQFNKIGTSKVVGFCHNFSIKHLLKADAIISVSKYIMDHHLIKSGFGVDRIFHIPNMIDLNHYQTVSPKIRINPIVIGAMGRFVKKKGFDDLIRASKILIDQGINLKVILGGGGEEQQNLDSLVKELDLKDSIQFIGWVHDKHAFYQQLDLFCLPSREEPFGIIALDTLAYGCPMIATRTSGPQEFLVDGKNAILCDSANPESLASAIERAIAIDSKDINRLVQNGLNTVKNYDIKVVSQQLVAALQKIIS